MRASGLALFLLVAPPKASVLADGLAPLGVGLAQTGTGVDLVVRSETSGEGCRLLLSDAETDAPVVGATLTLRSYGAAGHPAEEAPAVSGRFEGHYLSRCPGAGEALVVQVNVPDHAADLFAFTWPLASARKPGEPPGAPSPLQMPGALGLGALAVVLWRVRGRLKVTLVLGALAFAAGDASAHGVDEAGLPVAPGAEVGLGQELQFELGLRTAPVVLGTFRPPGRESGPTPSRRDGPSGHTGSIHPETEETAARSSPAVARSAVVERDGKKLVFVRTAPERFVAREVVLGWGDGVRVAVEGGLAPGELALVSGGAFLRNGGSRLLDRASAVPPVSGDRGPASDGGGTP